MPRQIQGSQTDFSFGEIDVALKRNDAHPARKGGLRQMVNARILNGGAVQNRSGRRALYPVTDGGVRTERITMSPGNIFDIQFAAGRLKIINAAGATVANFTLQGNGAALPWTALSAKNVVYATLALSIYVTFAGMRPQVVTWDGVATWTIADYTEQVIGSQKRTPFYRISPQGITLLPGAQTGVGVSLVASAALFTAAWIGAIVRFVNRQMLITAVADSTHATVTIMESLPGSQVLGFTSAVAPVFALGDELIGQTSGSKGIVVAFDNVNPTQLTVQLLTTSVTTVVTNTTPLLGFGRGEDAPTTLAFLLNETVSGPGGSLPCNSHIGVIAPAACAVWDDEVMNALRGYPASCFVDQFRVGFCNFPSVPGGIAWSAINSPTDLYVGAITSNAIFEIAPRKVQIYYVVPGPEGSEFIFCDRGVYYIPISETNPLKPGSVAFKLLSGDGAAQVQPRVSQEAILYVNAGQSSVMAILATGAYLRPFNTKNLSDYHGHLFGVIDAIAAPSADGDFTERYAYVLNSNGVVTVGKYSPDSLQTNLPVIGWGQWSSVGAVSWIAAHQSDVLFTSSYFGSGVVEVLDDTQYLDCALPVNALPAAFAAPLGKGPLWFIPGQSVTLIDQFTRAMGTYQIDGNGFIVPQNNGGEDLTIASLVAGQPWTMVVEPFAPIAQPGADMQQRMNMRQFSYVAAYVLNSTGFLLAKLFDAMQTRTSPALGSIVNQRRIPAWNQDDDATKPPTLRETVEKWTPPGASFDPRAAIIKDTPGPLTICEIAMEVTL